MSTADEGRKPAPRPFGTSQENEEPKDAAGARHGTLHAHPASLVGPDAPRGRPDERPAFERVGSLPGGAGAGVNRTVAPGPSFAGPGVPTSRDTGSPQPPVASQAQPAASAPASSDWLEDMSAFLRTETPSPVRNPFSVRTESQVSKTHPILPPSPVRDVAPAPRDEPWQPRLAPAVAPPESVVSFSREASPNDTVGRHELHVASPNDTVGRHELHVASPNDTVGRHELHVASPNDTVGRHELHVASPNDTVGRHDEPFSRRADAPSFTAAREPRAPGPDPSPYASPEGRGHAEALVRAVESPLAQGARQAPLATHPHMPLVAAAQAPPSAQSDSAGVMRRARRRPEVVSGALATATPKHDYSRSHTEDPGSPATRLQPVLGSAASGSYHLPATSADPFLEEGDSGAHAEDSAARPFGEHEQMTRTADAPSEMFSKALRLDDTLVDRPVVPPATPAEAPQGIIQGTIQGVDWRPSTDDRSDAADGDRVALVEHSSQAGSPLASVPTAPMTRSPLADVEDEFGDLQIGVVVPDGAAGDALREKPAELDSWQDAMSALYESNAPPQASLLYPTGEAVDATLGAAPVTSRVQGDIEARSSAAVHGSERSVTDAKRSSASPVPATRLPAAAPAGPAGSGGPSALVERLRFMRLPAMSRDTVVALVVGITVLFAALLFLFWVLAR